MFDLDGAVTLDELERAKRQLGRIDGGVRGHRQRRRQPRVVEGRPAHTLERIGQDELVPAWPLDPVPEPGAVLEPGGNCEPEARGESRGRAGSGSGQSGSCRRGRSRLGRWPASPREEQAIPGRRRRGALWARPVQASNGSRCMAA